MKCEDGCLRLCKDGKEVAKFDFFNATIELSNIKVGKIKRHFYITPSQVLSKRRLYL